MNKLIKVGFGGGCHWCTEAVFQSLKGVQLVEQGWISSVGENAAFSEAVIVHFEKDIISLETLISIHLLTHASDSNHSMREKYRSAVYTFDRDQEQKVKGVLDKLKIEFGRNFITKNLPFVKFKTNEDQYLNYFYNNPNNIFCKRYVQPKLMLLMKQFGVSMDEDKISKVSL